MMLSRNHRRGGDLHAAYEMLWEGDLMHQFDDRVWISIDREQYETFLRGEADGIIEVPV